MRPRSGLRPRTRAPGGLRRPSDCPSLASKPFDLSSGPVPRSTSEERFVAGKEKGRLTRRSAAPVSKSAALEVERRTHVEVAAQRIPGTRIRVAVARTGRAQVRRTEPGIAGRGQRRMLVKHVVHAKPEIVMISDCERRCQIEVIEWLHMQSWLEVRRAVERLGTV